MKEKDKLLKLPKKYNRGATGLLYEEAKQTKDPVLIREINKIIIKLKTHD